MKRLYSLDYLRGLAAFSIMIYHYSSWSLGAFQANTILGRLGLYGVSIFYVLSGLTLYYIYYPKMEFSPKQLFEFYKKRVLRIFPLLWLVTIVFIIISGQMPEYFKLFLNLSGLFSFIQWDAYISTGVWSIGNELVFYLFFPFFVVFSKRYHLLMILLGLAITILFFYFAFVILNPQLTLALQWKNYINPLNQVFLFYGGFLIGQLFEKIQVRSIINISILIFGLVTFIYYPVKGDGINLVIGTNRLVFSFCCFLICIAFFKLNVSFPEFIHKPLSFLGEASYSIYLLHPIIYDLTGILAKEISNHFVHIPQFIRLSFSIILTIIISSFVYKYFEKYFMRFGKNNP